MKSVQAHATRMLPHQHQLNIHIMWDNQAKWDWTQAHHIFSFLLDAILHSESYNLLQTSLKRICHSKVMTYWKVVKTIENIGTYFLKCLTLSPNQCANSDSFCLIIPHIHIQPYPYVITSFDFSWNLSSKQHENTHLWKYSGTCNRNAYIDTNPNPLIIIHTYTHINIL